MTIENHNRVELLRSDDFAQYLLHEPRQIKQILRALVDNRALITTYLPSGNQSFLTAMLALIDDEERLVFDASKEGAVNRRVAEAEELICATQVDGIKIQFPLDDIQEVTFEGRDAFLAARPDRLLRLQRREFYRLVAPITHALNCVIPLAQKDGPPRRLEVRVLDISGGGLAIAVPADEDVFSPGREFGDCRITLPDFGAITVRIKVRNLFRVTNRNGVEVLRAGCQFVDLPASANNLIQRYIFKVERDRSARERGM
ncbi:flagellar brake protein [Pseudothauera rhizosphaerae]|uniref:Flagellar brake protein YcgR n=1 Tax=Pseudothauera rhizosphaerae TaxID=2565932 RepID=A0A4V3WBQ8_9RHOO|nr:flagellar brake protein [Pseudothauera rhizosphaerae]THF64156.1 flagellar brake protein [Pseudothauera rhizosphaerae]